MGPNAILSSSHAILVTSLGLYECNVMQSLAHDLKSNMDFQHNFTELILLKKSFGLRR